MKKTFQKLTQTQRKRGTVSAVLLGTVHSDIMSFQDETSTYREESFKDYYHTQTFIRKQKTSIDVLQEREGIDVYWNVEWQRSLSDSWIGVTRFTMLKQMCIQQIFLRRTSLDKEAGNDET